MRRTNDPYLTKVLSRLGRRALLELAGLRSSEFERSKAYIRPSNCGVHPSGVVCITDGLVTASLFAKAQKEDYRGCQSLESESNFLSNVAPRIAAENPTLRSPSQIAYIRESGLLLMEFVPGNSLKHHLFDLTLGRPDGPDLGELLQYAGRWLGSLHRLTLEAKYGNPLDWLVDEFDKEQTKEAFVLYSLKDAYVEILSILKKCRELNPRFQRQQCNVHGEFTPLHVIVANGAIYVVDFGNTRSGYFYEDIGLFEGFYETLQPWRAFVGSYRIDLQVQKQLFRRGYLEQSPAPFAEADWAIMRWVRLISFARLLDGRQRRYNGWQNRVYARLASRVLRDRFIQTCCNELIALRELPVDIFDEDANAGVKSDSESCEPLRVAEISGD